MTRWVGLWPSEWPGAWQGGQGASRFLNMAMRASGSASSVLSLNTTLEMSMVAFGGSEAFLALSGGVPAQPEALAVSSGGGGRRRRTKARPLPLTPQQILDRRRRRREAEAFAIDAL